MKEEQKGKKELAKEFVKGMNEIEEGKIAEELIKNNKMKFQVGDKNYRVRKPNYAEQLVIEKFRREKYLGLVNDKNMLFRKQWVEKYKEKGIDIEKMEKDIIRLQNEIEAIMLRASKINNKDDIKKLEEDKLKLQGEQGGINIEKTDLLSHSIEDQLMIAVNSYYTYIALERLEEGKWVKVFSDYKSFAESEDTKLINQAFYYVNFLIYPIPFE